MPRHVLYAYIEGSDFEAVAAALEAEFVAFVAERKWVAGRAWAVNQRQAATSSDSPDDFPDWDLGVNLELPDPGKETPGWFGDVEAIARFLGRLNAEFGQGFIIGIAEASTGITEDLFEVSTPSPNMNELRAMIGVGETE